jgi:L-lactate dehydrogenase complex protein LldG
MSSKQIILNKIRKNKPQFVGDCNINFNQPKYAVEDFVKNLNILGGKALFINKIEQVHDLIAEQYPAVKNVVSFIDKISSNYQVTSDATIEQLDKIELAIVNAEFGVMENGAVWINVEKLVHRSILFITEHLFVILQKDSLVNNMQEAYSKLAELPSYGIFIAGPSKTADIERCTVIGAHGPMSLYVILL